MANTTRAGSTFEYPLHERTPGRDIGLVKLPAPQDPHLGATSAAPLRWPERAPSTRSHRQAGQRTRSCRSAIALWLCACALWSINCGSRSGSIEAECERVRDQLVELELSVDENREAHAGVMRRAMGKEFVANCARSMTETQRDCVLAAADSRSAFACIANAKDRAHSSLEVRRTK
jgi:hypothetical protein